MHIPVTVHEPFGYYPGRSPRSLAMHTHAHTHTHTHTSVRLLRPKQMQSCNLCTCFPRQHFLLGTNHTGPFCPYAPTPPRFFGTYSMMAAKSAANGARNLRHSDRSVRMELTKGPLSAKCIHTHTHTHIHTTTTTWPRSQSPMAGTVHITTLTDHVSLYGCRAGIRRPLARQCQSI